MTAYLFEMFRIWR